MFRKQNNRDGLGCKWLSGLLFTKPKLSDHSIVSAAQHAPTPIYEDMENIADFIGFYMKKGFWVEQRLDLSKYSDASKLCGPIAEVVYTYECATFKVAISIEGMIMLHHRELAALTPPLGDVEHFQDALVWWDSLLDYAYALQALLESATIRLEEPGEINATEIIPDNTATIGMAGWSPVSSNAGGNRVIGEEFRDLNRFVHFVRLHGRVPQHFDFSPYSWPEIKRATLDRAVKQFEYVVKQPKLLKWLAFIVRAKVAYGKNDFSMSLVHSWFIIESACKHLYASNLPGTASAASHLSVAEISKILHEQGRFSPDFKELLDKIRRVRNRLVHEPEQTRCSPEECQIAGQLAIDLATFGHNLDLILNWHCGVRC